MKIEFVAKPASDAAVLVVLVPQDGKLGARGEALDRSLSGALQRSLSLPRFKGKKGEIADILVPGGTKARRVILLGLGLPKEIDSLSLRESGGALAGHLLAEFEAGATVLVDGVKGGKIDEEEVAGEIALGASLRNYRFDRFLTKPKPDKAPALARLSLVVTKPAAAQKVSGRLQAIANGVNLARDLTNEPPNELYPESFVSRAKALAKLGVKVEALDEKVMAKLGLNALLSVGRGSANPPRLLVLQYMGAPAKKNEGPLAFVGKGVCFDSGGLCIKRSGAMYDMKGDMAGGAAVVGLIRALAERKAKVNVVGVVGLVENMPSGTSFKPGDIVKTLAGRTIEMIDTDAEGRLVLIDALYYTASRFKPKSIVDLATLTYSIQQALGTVFAGIFANNDDLANQLTAAGVAVGERLWRMPLDKGYDEHLESRIADIKHHADDAESGDAPHAAALLKQFVEDRPWAHLDIAGREFAAKDRATCPAGGTGYAVQLLEQFVAKAEDAI
ncbi:leucyl aminopeptidase [Dongia sp.]|uniref:leucyl aminopeptidase n=1 Tax=Dongia sp. TaxID=1977262 RepID=UPI0035B474B9